MIQMSGWREMSCCLFLDGTAEMMFLSCDSSFFSGEHAGKVFIVGSTDFRSSGDITNSESSMPQPYLLEQFPISVKSL